MIGRMPISRRTVLHGLGAAVALPWLEAMEPARLSAQATVRKPLRIAFLYHPIGAETTAWKGTTGEGQQMRLSPTLSPLEPVKEWLLVLEGLNGRQHPPGGHMGAAGPYLSSALPGKTDTWGAETGRTLDQILAEKLGDGMPLRSLEMSCNNVGRNMHSRFISWRAPGVPLGVETEPREIFARMFGDPKADFYRRSILDVVGEDARRLKATLGQADQGRLDEYLESVRTLERQIAAFEGETQKRPRPDLVVPEKQPASLPAYIKLMADLLILAFQTDLTRVVTCILGDETNEGTYPRRLVDFGIEREPLAGKVEAKYLDFGHHSCTHDPVPTRPLIQAIDKWYVQRLLYVLERLRSIREGDGTLLDHSIVVYGCASGGTGWPGHGLKDVACILAGKGGGLLKRPGRQVQYREGTPLGNLWLTLAQLAGIERKEFGASTGTLADLG
jgi:hypothetical protein